MPAYPLFPQYPRSLYSLFAINTVHGPSVAGLRVDYDARLRALAAMLQELSPEDRDRFFWRNTRCLLPPIAAAFFEHLAYRRPVRELPGEVDAGMSWARRGQREIGEGRAPREMAIV